MERLSGQVMKNLYSIRGEGSRWFSVGFGRRLWKMPLSTSLQEQGLCASLLPLQQTNKADVILGFLKAWSEQVRISRTRREKQTPLIISTTMALCRISRDASTAFSQPRPTQTPGFVPHPGDVKGEFSAASFTFLKFYGNFNNSPLLADGLCGTLTA